MPENDSRHYLYANQNKTTTKTPLKIMHSLDSYSSVSNLCFSLKFQVFNIYFWVYLCCDLCVSTLAEKCLCIERECTEPMFHATANCNKKYELFAPSFSLCNDKISILLIRLQLHNSTTQQLVNCQRYFKIVIKHVHYIGPFHINYSKNFKLNSKKNSDAVQ